MPTASVNGVDCVINRRVHDSEASGGVDRRRLCARSTHNRQQISSDSYIGVNANPICGWKLTASAYRAGGCKMLLLIVYNVKLRRSVDCVLHISSFILRVLPIDCFLAGNAVAGPGNSSQPLLGNRFVAMQ